MEAKSITQNIGCSDGDDAAAGGADGDDDDTVEDEGVSAADVDAAAADDCSC